MANRDGFIIKNYADTSGHTRIAGPDAVDFLALGNHRYGVLEGCSFNVSSTTIQIAPGLDEKNLVIVDGQFLVIPTTTLTINTGSTVDRFDLVVFDATTGQPEIVVGTPSADPVFPTLPDGMLMLAAILVPAGVTSLDATLLTDKRIMLPRSFTGSVADGAPLLKNQRAAGDIPFQINGDGQAIWKDVNLLRSGARRLKVGGHLDVVNDLTVGGALNLAGGLSTTAVFTADNWKRGHGQPAPTLGTIGDLYTDEDSGDLWIKKVTSNSGVVWQIVWSDEYPPGTIMSSVLTNSAPFLSGWVLLDGHTHPRSVFARLWDYLPAAWKTTISGSDYVIVPDMRQRMVMGADTPGALGGAMSHAISINNLPAHTHFGAGGSTGASGDHDHSVIMVPDGDHQHDIAPTGAHSHSVNDPGHKHLGSDFFGGKLIAEVWGGNNKLDGPIADASHTITVDAVGGVQDNVTGVTVASGGNHLHTMGTSGRHTHAGSTVSHVGGHTHPLPTENSVGGSQPLDITPAHLTVNYYIKT